MQVKLSLVLLEASQSSLGYILLEYAVLQITKSTKNRQLKEEVVLSLSCCLKSPFWSFRAG